MRMMITLASAVFVLSSFTVPASAANCPFPKVLVCRPVPKDRPPVNPPACRCEYPPGKTPYGGKAEIHKKNVPTVRSNRHPGPND